MLLNPQLLLQTATCELAQIVMLKLCSIERNRPVEPPPGVSVSKKVTSFPPPARTTTDGTNAAVAAMTSGAIVHLHVFPCCLTSLPRFCKHLLFLSARSAPLTGIQDRPGGQGLPKGVASPQPSPPCTEIADEIAHSRISFFERSYTGGHVGRRARDPAPPRLGRGE